MEKIEGWSVREVLGGGAEGEAAEEDAAEGEEMDETVGDQTEEEEQSEGMKALKKAGVNVEDLMSAIGTALARLHVTTIVHGDLTTSNMMVRLTPDRPGEPFEIVSRTMLCWASAGRLMEQVLIDFGLTTTAQYAENYAVDLYVLERAFASTHPQSEGMYAGVCDTALKLTKLISRYWRLMASVWERRSGSRSSPS